MEIYFQIFLLLCQIMLECRIMKVTIWVIECYICLPISNEILSSYNLIFYHVAASVEALSAVVLVVLFLLQKFGTSRVSFMFSPIMGAWTLCTPLVGIYSIIQHYPSIFKALSPHYIFHFFWRNGKEGWLLLGGTVLCITGGAFFCS
jgi:K+ transporter